MSLRAFSFGGGVQSVACLVLAAHGRIDYKTFVFADVGTDSEHPATMAYYEQYAKPFAERHGLELVIVQNLKRDGSFESILEKLHRTQRSIDIPVRMQNGAPGRRSC
ncbi:MAG: phosphoadenosine phosphosulfate reductase, partial [Candidatus Sericytochromatia bacterium]